MVEVGAARLQHVGATQAHGQIRQLQTPIRPAGLRSLLTEELLEDLLRLEEHLDRQVRREDLDQRRLVRVVVLVVARGRRDRRGRTRCPPQLKRLLVELLEEGIVLLLVVLVRQLQLGDANRLDEIDHLRETVPVGLQDVGTAVDDEGVGPLASFALPSSREAKNRCDSSTDRAKLDPLACASSAGATPGKMRPGNPTSPRSRIRPRTRFPPPPGGIRRSAPPSISSGPPENAGEPDDESFDPFQDALAPACSRSPSRRGRRDARRLLRRTRRPRRRRFRDAPWHESGSPPDASLSSPDRSGSERSLPAAVSQSFDRVPPPFCAESDRIPISRLRRFFLTRSPSIPPARSPGGCRW